MATKNNKPAVEETAAGSTETQNEVVNSVAEKTVQETAEQTGQENVEQTFEETAEQAIEETAEQAIEETAEQAIEETGEVLLVKFIKSPTGAFGLAYNVDDEVELPIALAAELVELEFAEAVGS